jgi:hypothetical protein
MLVDLTGLPALPALSLLDIAGNPSLTSLAGLPVLPPEARIRIVENNALRTLAGLEGNTACGSLSIFGNASLESLVGLQDLGAIGSGDSAEFAIVGNPVLSDASALAGVQSAPSLVRILDNASLDTCAVLDLVRPWAAVVTLEIAGNGPCAGVP